jgi:1-acyl-sn-glycerol-3-phosphate acyltransferase
MIRSLIVVSLTFLYTVLAGAIFIPYTLISRRSAALYRAGVFGIRLAMWLGGVRVRVEGRERIDPRATYVFMLNHVSNVDVAAMAFLPRVVVLTKQEVFRIPVLGRAMRMVGLIPVPRGTHQAAATVEAGVTALRGGRSMMVFPEGTRSPTEEMLPFRRGVFVMAIRAGVPVVPVTLLGTRQIMRKGDPRFHPGDVRMVLHEPIPTAGFSEQQRFSLVQSVRDAIASALDKG